MAPLAEIARLEETEPCAAKQVGLWTLICSDLACVRERDPAARRLIEILLCYPGFHAIAVHRVSNTLWQRGWRTFARVISHAARVMTGVDIHPGADIGQRFFIDHGCGVVIGETAEIGDDCTLYHGVTLGGVSWSAGKRHPTLKDGVLVGAGAKILGPIEVGAGARVGANSVVVEAVPPEATVVGIPARIVMRERTRPSSNLQADPLRIDLDHHLMPDPVARVIERMADRIAFLEVRLADVRRTEEAARRAVGDDMCCDQSPDQPFDQKSDTPDHPLN